MNRLYSSAEITGLMNLNHELQQLEAHLILTCAELRQKLQQQRCAADDPLADFEIDARLEFILKPTDDAYQKDEENILVSRDVGIGCIVDCQADDFNEHRHPQLSDIRHCYHFHDLYDHDWGPGQNALSWDDCLRIGEIRLAIRPVLQYCRSTLKGEWCHFGDQPASDRVK